MRMKLDAAIREMNRIDEILVEVEVEHDLALLRHDEAAAETLMIMYKSGFATALRVNSFGAPLTPYLMMKYRELQELS